MLSKDEKEKLERQVILERQRKPRVVAENDRNSCVAKGKSVVLTQFFRVARNMMNLCFKNDPTVTDVEEEYWKLVSEKSQHIAVQWARVDTSVAGSGFPTGKSHPYAKHNWNLNNLARNQGNLLSHLGSEPDVTIPWLKVGMVYSTEFWKYDPYALPFVEYQHTGADKIWYCVPHSHKEKFETVMKSVVPEMCINNSNRNYLAKSSVMVSPTNLAKEGVPITRVVIENGEYLVTFPGCYTSSICCGYNVSECIYYALPSWVQFATQANKVTKELRLPPMFSFERLICLASTIEVTKGNTEIIECLLHELKLIRDLELQLREQLMLTGVKSMAKMAVTNVVMNQDLRRKKILKIQVDPEDKRCDTCQQLCHLSQVVNDKEEDTYCLQHALNYIKKGGSKACNGLKLMYRYEKEQLNKLVEQLEDCLNDKSKISPGRGRTSNKRKCTESVVELLS
ncbi:protein Jumonji-like [Saccoglossus kowalevskii]